MRKIITFLGTRPQDTIYEWQGKSYPGKVFATALRQFVAFDQMLVLTTKEAALITWPMIEELNDDRIIQVPIPDSSSTEGMWGIFQAVIDRVDEGETIIFDITHGFRLMPFLAFLFAAYLKSAKQIKIEAVYYGAFEMASQNNGQAPVIDLSQFVMMLDWITAADQFVQSGNANSLAKLLNPNKLESGVLFEASNTLQTISQTARLVQPFTLMRESSRLAEVMDKAKGELQSSARPFEIVREKIVSAFAQFEDDGQNITQRLAIELRMVQWYYQNGQIIQAVTLAREWLIDAVTIRLEEPLNFDLAKRKPIEEALSGVGLIGKPHPQQPERFFTEDDLNRFGLEILKWEEIETLKQLWTNLKNVRNPLDHAEHQVKKEKERSLDSLRKLQRKLDEKVMPVLAEIARKWGYA